MDSLGSSSRIGSIRRRLEDGFVRRIGIDLRALATFRVGVALLLLVNLASRSRYLDAFHTDLGVLPTGGLIRVYGEFNGIHALIGEPWLQLLLFPFAGVVALALLVGYRSRIATVVSFVLLLLLHSRNPMVLNGGDVLLSSLLFWAMFLPLGERWSLDARRFDRDRQSVSSIASLAILIQVFLVYGVNASHKVDSDVWMSGEAMVGIFQAEQFTIFLGPVLAEMHTLLTAFNYLWLALLLASPLLLLLRGVPRAVLATLFAGMHFGMFLTMPIGLFPWVSITGLVLFYPPIVWETLGRIAAWQGLDSVARERTEWIETRTPTFELAVPDDPRLDRVADGVRFVVLSLLPAVVLVLILLSAMGTADIADPPDQAENAVETIRMEQTWRMFAPNPVTTTRWMAMPANRTDGTTVDAFHDGPVSLEKPANVADSYPTFRWRKVLTQMRTADSGLLRSHFSKYLCEQYNRTHSTDLQSVSIYYGYERVDPRTGEIEASGGRTLFEYDCHGPTIQRDG